MENGCNYDLKCAQISHANFDFFPQSSSSPPAGQIGGGQCAGVFNYPEGCSMPDKRFLLRDDDDLAWEGGDGGGLKLDEALEEGKLQGRVEYDKVLLVICQRN